MLIFLNFLAKVNMNMYDKKKGKLTEEIQTYHGGLRPRELGQAPISASVIVSLAVCESELSL